MPQNYSTHLYVQLNNFSFNRIYSLIGRGFCYVLPNGPLYPYKDLCFDMYPCEDIYMEYTLVSVKVYIPGRRRARNELFGKGSTMHSGPH